MKRVLAALMVLAVSANGLRIPAARAQVSVDIRGARQQALAWVQSAGPNLARAARAALVGADADVLDLVRDRWRRLQALDERARLEELVGSAGPALRAEVLRALAAPAEDAWRFVERGWQGPLDRDLRLSVARAMATGGARVRGAAQEALQTGQVQEFLLGGYAKAQELDERVAVAQLLTFGGLATAEAAQRVLSGSGGEVHAFLESGYELARARDLELATLEELAAQAAVAGGVAEAGLQAAEEGAEQAEQAALLGARSAERAAAEAQAARGREAEARAAADRAEAAADRAGAAADRATAATHGAQAASSAARRAASLAAAAAARASAAAARARSEQMRAREGQAQARAAREAADRALSAVNSARTADLASIRAYEVAKRAEQVAAATAAVYEHYLRALDANEEAQRELPIADAQAERARSKSAEARRLTQVAQRAADQAGDEARAAADAASRASAMAQQAAEHAESAAAASREAEAHLGDARWAAEHAGEASAAASAAADTATLAAAEAGLVFREARQAEAERLELETSMALRAAEALRRAELSSRRAGERAVLEQDLRDETFRSLLEAARAPGTSQDVRISNGRKLAEHLLERGGPWSQAAARDALVGSDDNVAWFVAEGLAAAAEQDDRDRLRELAESTQSDDFWWAATEVLELGIEDVREFLRFPDYEGKEREDALTLAGLLATGGPATRAGAQRALSADQTVRREFLERGRLVAAVNDARIEIAAVLATGGPNLIQAAQVALAGPEAGLERFLSDIQYRARQLDAETETHVARAQAQVALAEQHAAQARGDAALAAEAAARAGGSAAEADGHAARARLEASSAAAAAEGARQAAARALASAERAEDAAARARGAAERAQAADAVAERAAAAAADSRAQTHAHAAAAFASAQAAEQSWQEARADSALAQQAKTQALAIAAERERQEARALAEPAADVAASGGAEAVGDTPSWNAEDILVALKLALDIVGFFDPTGAADGASALISAAEFKWLDAGASLLGIVGGDAAKLGKIAKAIGRLFPSLARVVSRGAEVLKDVLQAVVAVLRREGPNPQALWKGFKEALTKFSRGGDECGSRCGLPSTCFAAGTLVSTELGALPIESIALGDRVGPAWPSCMALDTSDWLLLEARVPVSDAGEQTELEVALLRPRRWLAERGAAPGQMVDLDLSELYVTASGYVTAVRPAPALAPGERCPVTGLFRHPSPSLLRLALSDGSSLDVTRPHRFFSLDRGDWISAARLVVGERLQSQASSLTVQAIDWSPQPVQDVHNLEVHDAHYYFVGEGEVLAHNAYERSTPAEIGQVMGRNGNRAVRPVLDDIEDAVGSQRLDPGQLESLLRGRFPNQEVHLWTSGRRQGWVSVDPVPNNRSAFNASRIYVKLDSQGLRLQVALHPTSGY